MSILTNAMMAAATKINYSEMQAIWSTVDNHGYSDSFTNSTMIYSTLRAGVVTSYYVSTDNEGVKSIIKNRNNKNNTMFTRKSKATLQAEKEIMIADAAASVEHVATQEEIAALVQAYLMAGFTGDVIKATEIVNRLNVLNYNVASLGDYAVSLLN